MRVGMLRFAVMIVVVTLTMMSDSSTNIYVSAGVVLNEKMMNLIRASAELSILAYSEDPNAEYIGRGGNEFDHMNFYDEEPDQAIVTKFNNQYCFASFRGTMMTKEDWFQNLDLGTEKICDEVNGECCHTREGFYKAYYADYSTDFETSLRDCAKDCANPDECVVLTGHSQGGAIAQVAGVILADLSPYVITFGTPRTILEPCQLIQSSRWFGFINTKESPKLGIVYDPIPFVPGLGADFFGHMILLSDDTTGVAYVGKDAHEFFHPLDPAGIAHAHSMGGGLWNQKYPGYIDRIRALMENATYPIRNNGYVAGSVCSKDKECQTGKCESETTVAWNRCVGLQCAADNECNATAGLRCESGICLPKLGSCSYCDEDSDCEGPSCHLFRCTNDDDRMDDNCVCGINSDCESGRCEGLFPPICEATKADGAKCNEDSDCMSGECSWNFRCGDKDSIRKVDGAAENKTSVWRVLAIIAIALLVLIIGCFGIQQCLKRKQGYQEISISV